MKERLVAVLDVLGFSNYIKTRPKEFKTYLAPHFNLKILSWFEKYLNCDFPEFLELPIEDPRHKMKEHLEYVNFSDTFLVYTPNSSLESFISIIRGCSAMIAFCLSQSFPLRGAITKGDMYVSKTPSIQIGQALVEAYELEIQQDWCGAVLDHKISRHEPYKETICDLVNFGGLVVYEVPFRCGNKVKYLALGWHRFNRAANREMVVNNWLEDTPGGEIKKANTLDFWDYVREKYG